MLCYTNNVFIEKGAPVLRATLPKRGEGEKTFLV
jgi:hypothetical protein